MVDEKAGNMRRGKHTTVMKRCVMTDAERHLMRHRFVVVPADDNARLRPAFQHTAGGPLLERLEVV